MINIWTDGGCYPNPGGPGGYGVHIVTPTKTFSFGGNSKSSTNNVMELTAAIEALKFVKSPSNITITADSKYVVDGITKWIDGWIKKGWKNSAGKPVANKKLWKKLYKLNEKHNVTWKWVKGHAGCPENEIVDKIATKQREAV